MPIPVVVKDIWKAIHEDGYIWLVIWGRPRVGKSTVAMWLLYYVYKDWNKVLDAIIYNMPQLLYKLDHKIPATICTDNKFHDRVPILNWDDFGVHSNKAITQHERSFDIFKGGFDALGTEIAVLISTMVDPREPTQQLQDKYTHEIFVPVKGIYKYDECDWEQDYKGWKARMKKNWIELQEFEKVPREIYVEYDKMRMSLVPEVKQRIKDAIAESQVESILKRIKPYDIELLELILANGPVWYGRIKNELGSEKTKEALTRLRARNLVTPIRHETGYYTYDISDLGLEVLNTYNQPTDSLNITKTTSPHT